MTISSEVDEGVLRELYLVPFEGAVTEAGAWGVMTRVQPPQRHVLQRARVAAHDDPARRVGLRRLRHLRLVRHPQHRARRERRARPGDARAAAVVRPIADRCRGERRGRPQHRRAHGRAAEGPRRPHRCDRRRRWWRAWVGRRSGASRADPRDRGRELRAPPERRRTAPPRPRRARIRRAHRHRGRHHLDHGRRQRRARPAPTGHAPCGHRRRVGRRRDDDVRRVARSRRTPSRSSTTPRSPAASPWTCSTTGNSMVLRRSAPPCAARARPWLGEFTDRLDPRRFSARLIGAIRVDEPGEWTFGLSTTAATACSSTARSSSTRGTTASAAPRSSGSGARRSGRPEPSTPVRSTRSSSSSPAATVRSVAWSSAPRPRRPPPPPPTPPRRPRPPTWRSWSSAPVRPSTARARTVRRWRSPASRTRSWPRSRRPTPAPSCA